MAHILITGGAGFIGSHTAEALIAQGHRVRILDCLDPQIHGPDPIFPPHLHPEVERLRGDVLDPEALESALRDVEAVYHFAAQTGVGQSMYDMGGYVQVNSVGTARLIEAILKGRHSVRRLVLASSRAVYGEGTARCPEHGLVHPAMRRREDLERGRFDVACPHCGGPCAPAPTPEERPLHPVSVYGLTKKQQEELVLYAHQTLGLETVSLRYFNVYGSRQSLKNPYTGVVTVFFNRIMAGQPISLYERGLPVRDFVHIRDVVQANIAALTADAAVGHSVNVGSGTAAAIRDIAEALVAACGQPCELVETEQFRVGDIYSCVADLTRAQDLLGYAPLVQLDEGMREFVAWARGEETADLYEKTVRELSRHGLFGGST